MGLPGASDTDDETKDQNGSTTPKMGLRENLDAFVLAALGTGVNLSPVGTNTPVFRSVRSSAATRKSTRLQQMARINFNRSCGFLNCTGIEEYNLHGIVPYGASNGCRDLFGTASKFPFAGVIHQKHIRNKVLAKDQNCVLCRKRAYVLRL